MKTAQGEEKRANRTDQLLDQVSVLHKAKIDPLTNTLSDTTVDPLTHLKAKFLMFMVAYNVINNAAIMQPSLPPTVHPRHSVNVLIKPSSKLVIYTGTMLWYPGYKNFPTTYTLPIQSNAVM